MSTKKPIIQCVVRGITYNKIKTIAKEKETSVSRIGAELIERAIEEYEAEHGEIIANTCSGGGYRLIYLSILANVATSGTPSDLITAGTPTADPARSDLYNNQQHRQHLRHLPECWKKIASVSASKLSEKGKSQTKK